MERAYENRLKFSLCQVLDAAVFEKTLHGNILADLSLPVDFFHCFCVLITQFQQLNDEIEISKNSLSHLFYRDEYVALHCQ